MKIGIVCAGYEELRPFIPIIENCIVTERAGLEFHEGFINGVSVTALFSGVCKVNAAIASQILIDIFGADIIINSGTAGGMNPELEIFDTVISTEVCYHDVLPANLMDFHPKMKSPFFKANDELIKLSLIAASKTDTRGKTFAGRMVTGESFITDEGRERINRLFAPLSVDMETAGIAHVCHVNSIPFVAIRCITDTARHSGVENFEKNCGEASAIAVDITVALIKELSLNQNDIY
ncbi:MAG: 5'-methylthioadenosine/S-adenosylhomocysteine nucleosidase [Clostridiales bacterium]|nr:5'-methylthioadenosine/S-adenosylhomocysteine nucleosidase [Bacillota bacterium]MEE0517873.1 5'-methylthioadenosine/S-adenosylhomocysteine nucleosidase [Anaerovoracaceae bacterium]PWL93194.1 MAG: 5'-methylthioadenosine/S-adenosylhomocysteine nucleosidase [Clostridiales bacterium]